MFKRKVYRHIVKCSLSPQGPKLIVYTIPDKHFIETNPSDKGA